MQRHLPGTLISLNVANVCGHTIKTYPMLFSVPVLTKMPSNNANTNGFMNFEALKETVCE